MFSLTMRQGNRTPFVLQQDKVLPESRGCPFGYRIQDVYIFHGKDTPPGGYIVVFLNMSVPGFEGGDMRFLAVTGRIKG